MAQAKWCKNNQTTNIPSYNESVAANDQEAQNKIIEAIQLEQNRVYQQDLQLLKNINQGEDVSSIGDNSQLVGNSVNASPDENNRAQEEPYKMKQLEDDIIKYICEKIVAMREQPFIDAVDNLRRAQELNNLQMIMNLQREKQTKLANQSATFTGTS